MNISNKMFELSPPSYKWLAPIGFVSDQIASSNLRPETGTAAWEESFAWPFCFLKTRGEMMLLAAGKLTVCGGKSPCSIGKSHLQVGSFFQPAMLVYWSVNIENDHLR